MLKLKDEMTHVQTREAFEHVFDLSMTKGAFKTLHF